jgi:hypothetical protein
MRRPWCSDSCGTWRVLHCESRLARTSERLEIVLLLDPSLPQCRGDAQHSSVEDPLQRGPRCGSRWPHHSFATPKADEFKVR